MRKKRLIPFWLVPAHWGLSGKAKEIAEVNFYYEGLEADLKIAELTYLTEYEVERAKIEINRKYNPTSEYDFNKSIAELDYRMKKISVDEHEKILLELRVKEGLITEKEYDASLIENMADGDDKVLAAIEYAYKYGDINDTEYEKEIFTLRKEPWIYLDFNINSETNEVDFIFDYNDYFVDKLKADGHPGSTEEELIDNFVRDLGRKMATDDYSDNDEVKLLTPLNESEMPTGIPEGFKSYK